MTITINAIPIDVSIENEKTVGDLLDSLRTICTHHKQSIYEICVDNELCQESAVYQKCVQKPLTENTAIAIKTLSADELIALVGGIIHDMHVHLNQLEKQVQELSHGDLSPALTALRNYSDSFEQLLICLTSTSFSPLQGLTHINQKEISEYLAQIKDFLSDITDAFDMQDVITIADIAEYELKPISEQLIEAIDAYINKKNEDSSC